MAEERLIDNDEDKDRKYVIRTNEDGEDELIILSEEERGEAAEEEENYDGFEVPELDTDDEEAAVMTPEQLAERDRRLQAEREQRDQTVARYLARASECLEERDYDGGLNALELAEAEDDSNADIAVMKFRMLSRDLTDFTSAEDLLDAAEGVRDKCSEEQRAELFSHAEPLAHLIALTRDEADKYAEENRQKRAERQVVFTKRLKTAAENFLFAFVPFVVFLILAISYSTIMFSAENGLYLILTVAFAVVAFLLFVATLIRLSKLWQARHNLRLNAKDSSTKLGRMSEEAMERYKILSGVYDALGGKK